SPCPLLYSPSSSSILSFKHPTTTDLYTLSLHDALPIFRRDVLRPGSGARPASLDRQVRPVEQRLRARLRDGAERPPRRGVHRSRDRKSTRLNSSHVSISYAVFCLKKKNRGREPRPLEKRVEGFDRLRRHMVRYTRFHGRIDEHLLAVRPCHHLIDGP